jgi:hypothetical protein
MLFGRISALSNQIGYCWATDDYLAELSHCKDRVIQDRLKILEKKGYIIRQTEKKGMNWERKIIPLYNDFKKISTKGMVMPYEAHGRARSSSTGVPNNNITVNNIKQQQASCIKNAAAAFSLEKKNYTDNKLLQSCQTSQDNNSQQLVQSENKHNVYYQDVRQKRTCNFSESKKDLHIHECLKYVDIPMHDKLEISRKHAEPIVKNALKWAINLAKREEVRCMAASIKYACNRGLKCEIRPVKKTIYDELCQYFKNDEQYNNAYCYLNQTGIAFQRGMHHEQLKIDQYFSWDKFKKLCDNFGISFMRQLAAA